MPAPTVERPPIAIDVDTSRDAQLALICTGAFGELGADPSRPTVSVPVGTTEVVVSGGSVQVSSLDREVGGGSDPRVFESPVTATLAAAELQQLNTPTLQGFVASACTEPAHEQWLVGGGASLGMSSTIVLANPFAVPATVQLSIYDETGQIDERKTAGVLVPPATQRIVSLNGYAPASEMLAVRVESTGAAVSAHLSVSHKIDIRSFAIDTVTSQAAPQSTLVFAGVTNFNMHDHGPTGELNEHEDFAVTARVLSTSGAGSGNVTALFADGTSEVLGVVEFDAAVVTEFMVPHWPEEAQALVIDANQPIVASVLGSADVPPDHDYAWFAPTPVLPADTEVGIAVVDGGQLVLANTGSSVASVTLEPGDSALEDVVVEVPVGAAVVVEGVSGGGTLTSTAPVSAGVRVIAGANIAGYPVLAPPQRTSSLTVYPR